MLLLDLGCYRIFNTQIGKATREDAKHVANTSSLHSDQVYFERVHPCIPILHEQSYYSWSTDMAKSEPQICLQLTMWALASSASAQLPAIGLALYHDARRRLGDLEAAGRGHEMIDATLAQAWLLLSIFEFVRVDHHRGWMSAGRAFRWIQLMRLHEEDRCTDTGLLPDPREWVRKEERRRTFWVAYALDRFVGVSDGSPSTFSEDVRTRLCSYDLRRNTNGSDVARLTFFPGRRPSSCTGTRISKRSTRRDAFPLRCAAGQRP